MAQTEVGDKRNVVILRILPPTIETLLMRRTPKFVLRTGNVCGQTSRHLVLHFGVPLRDNLPSAPNGERRFEIASILRKSPDCAPNSQQRMVRKRGPVGEHG